MTACPVNTVSSNEVTLHVAEELCVKTLTSADYPTYEPTFLPVEVNSFSDFGADLTKVMRKPLSPSRQRRKGRTVGSEAVGGWAQDIVGGAIDRMMQGFLFADAVQLASTELLSDLPGTHYVSSVTADTIVVSRQAGMPKTEAFLSFAVNDLIMLSGFQNQANNGLHRITGVNNNASANITLTVTGITAEDAGAQAVETVGRQYSAGALSVVVTSGIASLVGPVGAFSAAVFAPGTWIFLGGDEAVTKIGTNVGYARLGAVAADGSSVVLEETTFVPVTNAGAAKTARIFIGASIFNRKNAADIVERTYSLVRTYPTAAGTSKTERITGSAPNELTLTIPTEEKLTAEMTLMGCDVEYGTQATIGGTFLAQGDSPEAFNSTSDIVRMRVNLRDITVPDPTPLVGYVQEASVTLTNNLSANKAVGVFGTLDYNIGTLEVGGSITAYFTDTDALSAIRNDMDVEFNLIAAYDNRGIIIDLPLLSLSGGKLNVEEDAPVTLPIEMSAVEGANGFTMVFQSFRYLPAVAMPA